MKHNNDYCRRFRSCCRAYETECGSNALTDSISHIMVNLELLSLLEHTFLLSLGLPDSAGDHVMSLPAHIKD